MLKHTPGPWTIHHWGDADIEVVAKDNTVCNVPGFEDSVVDPPETKANARLIAAAPELLYALRCLVEHDECYIKKGIWHKFVEVERARALLDRLTKGEP